jgi:hypothetical protein
MPSPWCWIQSHAEILKNKYSIYEDELDILHVILSNLLNSVAEVLSDQNGLHST